MGAVAHVCGCTLIWLHSRGYTGVWLHTGTVAHMYGRTRVWLHGRTSICLSACFQLFHVTPQLEAGAWAWGGSGFPSGRRPHRLLLFTFPPVAHQGSGSLVLTDICYFLLSECEKAN